jgi:Hemerythrin HHE cation binding domain
MTDNEHDLIEILAHDHRELEGKFRELRAARDPDERRRILDDVTIELLWHAVVEETHLYPAVRRHLPDGDRIADRYTSENAQVERLIEEVYDHIRAEQHALVPRLAEHVRPDDLRRLGERVESAINSAPTRSELADPDPHRRPYGPSAAELAHRVRDRLADESGRRPARSERPRTLADPDANDQSSMWPDLWADHRCR